MVFRINKTNATIAFQIEHGSMKYAVVAFFLPNFVYHYPTPISHELFLGTFHLAIAPVLQ
ncbi:MAG: hypothetical protein RIR11_3836 [Bacteroidota bacterium]|jgi:hypothetical protein